MAQGVITEDEAQAVAQQIIELLRMPFALLGGGYDSERIVATVQKAIQEPDRLQGELVAEILSGKTSVEEFRREAALVGQMLRAPRRLMHEVAKELPVGAPGRVRQASGTDAQIAEFANWLLPFMRVLARERKRSTKRSLAETIAYLEADFPEQSEYSLRNISRLEEVFADRKLLATKRDETRARTVTYVLTGNEFGMKRLYALRQVRSALGRHDRHSQSGT